MERFQCYTLVFALNKRNLKHIFDFYFKFLTIALGRKAYLDACSQLGIIPVSFVVEHITREQIDIKHHGLGPSGARAIAFALTRNTTTTTLNLQDCGVGKKISIRGSLKTMIERSHF